MIKKLIKKFKGKKFIVGIIGLGYVGLPVCERFASAKIEVIGIDSDKLKIAKLKKGQSYINSEKLKNFTYFKKKKKNISDNYQILKRCDVILICLPTPLIGLKPDMSYIFKCAKKLRKNLKPNHVVILESTVYPGATLEFAKKLNTRKFTIGKDLFLGYSPERENPGDKNFSYKTTPKVYKRFFKKMFKISELNLFSYCKKSSNCKRN